MMKSNEYTRILILPPLLFCYAHLVALLVMVTYYRTKAEHLSRWVAINAFSDIFKMKKEKTCCRRETQWLFKEIDMTARETPFLSKVLIKFLILFVSMLSVVLMFSWQLLLWDASYDCDEDDLNKDCFERKWGWEPLDPLNCSSAAVQDLIRNGTIHVICYKFAFNFGLATGAGYGSFKLSLFSINVGTSLMLMIKDTKILRYVRGIGVFLLVAVMTSVVVVVSVIPSVERFFTDNVAVFAQISATTVTAVIFLYTIPWKEIIDLNVRRENP